MKRDMQEKVLSLLESCEQVSRALQLMQYELQSTPRISPEDVIEVMSLQRKNEENTADFPHDVERIATCFRNVTDRWNQEAISEISEQYVGLLQKRDRLLYYINLPETRQKYVITEYYIEGRNRLEIAKELNITRRTAYNIRKDAVKELAEMYAMKERLFNLASPKKAMAQVEEL